MTSRRNWEPKLQRQSGNVIPFNNLANLAKLSYIFHIGSIIVILLNVVYNYNHPQDGNNTLTEHAEEWFPFQFSLAISKNYPFNSMFKIITAVYIFPITFMYLVILRLFIAKKKVVVVWTVIVELFVMIVTFLIITMIEIKEDENLYNKSFIVFTVLFIHLQYQMIDNSMLKKTRIRIFLTNIILFIMLLNSLYRSSVDFQFHTFYKSWLSLTQCAIFSSFGIFNYSLRHELGQLDINFKMKTTSNKLNLV